MVSVLVTPLHEAHGSWTRQEPCFLKKKIPYTYIHIIHSQQTSDRSPNKCQVISRFASQPEIQPCTLPTYPTDPHARVPVPVPVPSLSSSGIVITIRSSSPKRPRHAFIPPSRRKTVHLESGGRASISHPAQCVARPSDDGQWETMIGILVRRGTSWEQRLRRQVDGTRDDDLV